MSRLRPLLAALLSLALALPGPLALALEPPDRLDVAPAAPAADDDGAKPRCHDAGGAAPNAPTMEQPLPATGDPPCCDDCSCDCRCSIGKGLSIGPAHLASSQPAQPGPGTVIRAAAAAAIPLQRPPIPE